MNTLLRPYLTATEWGGEKELWCALSDFTASCTALESTDSPAQRVLHHVPGAVVLVHYRLKQERADYLQDLRGAPFRIVVQPTYFHLVGNAVLVMPDMASTIRVLIRQKAMPPSWTFASDLQHGSVTLETVRESIIVGGDFKVLRPSSINPAIRIAIRGSWRFDVEQFGSQLASILDAQRKFWRDSPVPYLVTILQLPEISGGTISGGTGRGDAFVFFATPNTSDKEITAILAHEGLHTWIPRLIGALPERDEALGYWLSEGFTDFYRSRLLFHSRIWTEKDFAEDLNRVLKAYAASPVRAAPNSRILAEFWSDQHIQRLSYQRGYLFALWSDEKVRDRGGLDAMLRDMRRRAAERRARHQEALFAPQLFIAAMAGAGYDVRSDIANYIDAGVPIALPKTLLAPCGFIKSRDLPRGKTSIEEQHFVLDESLSAKQSRKCRCLLAGRG